MGEYADYIIDRMIFGPFRNQRTKRKGYQKGTGNFKWKDSSGKILDMKDMSTEYLQNCLNKCRENNNTGKEEQILKVLSERNNA